MPISSWVEETHGGSADVSDDGVVTLVRTFRLFTGNAASRPAWAVAGIGINKYDVHPDDSTCLARSVNSTPIAGELGHFDVSYVYSNRSTDVGTTDTTANSGAPGQNDPVVQPNPTLRTPVVSWTSNVRSVPFTRDWSNPRRPVVNSAGQPFEGLEIEDFTEVISVQFNMLLPDVSDKQTTYKGKVNDDFFGIIPVFTPYPPGTLRCNNWQGTFQREEGFGWFTACTVEFEYNPNGWIKEVIDAGWYERIFGDAGYVTKKIVGKGGQALDAPVKLDGFGKKLEPGANPAVNPPFFVVNGGTPDVTVYARYVTNEQVDFTNIFAA